MGHATTQILALIGSPRKQGNTDIMANEVLEGAKSVGATTDKIYLDDYWVRPIGDVVDDSRERDDPRKDDDFPSLLERFLAADIVVWATPVYWQGASAQMKCFLDRLSSYFNHPNYRDRFAGKGHAVLCTYGRPEARHGDWVIEPMKLTVEVLRGTYLGDVRASVYPKGKVAQMPEVLAACRKLGMKAVWAMQQQECRSKGNAEHAEGGAGEGRGSFAPIADEIAIRPASEADLAEINAIYNHYVAHSTCVWTTTPSSEAERKQWYAEHNDSMPVVVAECSGRVIGWGALGTFRTAYTLAGTLEDSIYVHHDFLRKGIGSRILTELVAAARRIGLRSILANISADQTASIRLHEKFGFQRVAHLRQVGRKFSRSFDAIYMQLLLSDSQRDRANEKTR